MKEELLISLDDEQTLTKYNWSITKEECDAWLVECNKWYAKAREAGVKTNSKMGPWCRGNKGCAAVDWDVYQSCGRVGHLKYDDIDHF